VIPGYKNRAGARVEPIYISQTPPLSYRVNAALGYQDGRTREEGILFISRILGVWALGVHSLTYAVTILVLFILLNLSLEWQ